MTHKEDAASAEIAVYVPKREPAKAYESPLKGKRSIRIEDPYNLNRFRVPRSARAFKRQV